MRRLLPAVLLCAFAVFPATASAGTDTSTNWAGYGIHRSGVRFRVVTAAWTVPAVTCTGRATESATWIGIGGYHTNAAALEQVGTESDCTRSGHARYSAWYELLPDFSKTLHMTVKPGDQMSARVNVSGLRVRIRLRDLTGGMSFDRRLTAQVVDTTSAEWIVEDPAECRPRCKIMPLARFSATTFTSAHATSTTGHTGTIADPLWVATAIDLTPDGRPLGDANGHDHPGGASASAGELSVSGGSFTVTAT